MMGLEGGESEARALRRAFDAVTQGTRRFESAEDVLEMYARPLEGWFGKQHVHGLSHSQGHGQHAEHQRRAPSLIESIPPASFSASGSVDSAGSSDRVDVLLVEALQTSLLVRLCVDWASSLGDAWRTLLELAFFGPSSAGLGPVGVVQQCTLRTLSRLLASAEGAALQETVQLCVRARDALSLRAMIGATTAAANPARAAVAWAETLRLLGALPDRVANATKGDVPDALTPQTWIQGTLVRGLGHALDQDTDAQHRQLLKDVLARLDRLGHLAGGRFWPMLLRTATPKTTTHRQWGKLRRTAGSTLRSRLDTALLQTLKTVQRGTDIVAPTERGKPGTEGTAFLSPETQAVVAALAHVLGIFIPSDVEDGSESDDSASGSSPVVRAFRTAALSRVPQSAVLGWAWSVYLVRACARDRLDCLTSVLDRWADAARLARVLVDEELFLSTLALCLVASLPPGSEDEAMEGLAHSRTVLDGVSAHLAHADPVVRRTGMLVAELLSARTARQGAKTLSFGAGIWDGTHDGREEARVLRALYHAWKHHAAAIAVHTHRFSSDPDAALHALGFGTQRDEVTPQKAKTEAPSKARAEGGKTRRLPARVAPPQRDTQPRRLISVIGSDDELGLDDTRAEGPLRMFRQSARSQRTRSVSSGSSSSSSADSDAGSDGDEMHKLAADLSGLGTDEAASLLSSVAPASRRRAGGEVDDFDADREAHAPQFTQRVRAPVYVSQLSALLKSSARHEVKLGLKHAAALVSRKATTRTFGGEVEENAVDLTLALVALHDNFGIRSFEAMRRQALVQLACAAPVSVAAVLTEQVFGSQYSAVQRMAMLYALTEAALKLSGAEQEEQEGAVGMGERADAVGARALSAARQMGEARVPQLRRERDLRVRSSGLVEQLTPHSLPSSEGMGWELLAGQFIFPLLNRLLAYQSLALRGAGSGGLFAPDSLALLLDTLSILVSIAPASVLRRMAPLVLEAISTVLLARPEMDVSIAAALNALAVLVHAHLGLDQAASLLADPTAVRMLRQLMQPTQSLFAQLNTSHGLAGRIAAKAAAVLLQLDQLDHIQQTNVRNALGFVP